MTDIMVMFSEPQGVCVCVCGGGGMKSDHGNVAHVFHLYVFFSPVVR